jgi:hypothetical protein
MRRATAVVGALNGRRAIALPALAAASVIASEAKQSENLEESLDCFGATAPRNDG